MSAKDDLIAEAKEKGLTVPEGATKAEIQTLLDDNAKAVDEGEGTTPAEVAAEDIEKSGVQGVAAGSTENTGAGADEPDAVSEGDNDEDQTVAPQADGIDGVERDHTPAGTTEEANAGDAGERLQPPVAANGLSADASDEAYEANTQVNPHATAHEVKEAEAADNEAKVETRKAEAKVVETELGTSEEEAAAARAGVDKVALDNPKQNREPKNEFEVSNQKVTEEERQAAQEVSDMTTAAREDEAPTPNESAVVDAQRTAETNQGSAIADAIRAGLEGAKEDKNIKIVGDDSVVPRFTVVKSKTTGEVMLRENETGVLSKVQLESIEEKEASIQTEEVEEV